MGEVRNLGAVTQSNETSSIGPSRENIRFRATVHKVFQVPTIVAKVAHNKWCWFTIGLFCYANNMYVKGLRRSRKVILGSSLTIHTPKTSLSSRLGCYFSASSDKVSEDLKLLYEEPSFSKTSKIDLSIAAKRLFTANSWQSEYNGIGIRRTGFPYALGNFRFSGASSAKCRCLKHANTMDILLR